MPTWFRRSILGLALLGLAACAGDDGATGPGEPPVPPTPPGTAPPVSKAPLAFDVGQIELLDLYEPPGVLPNVDHALAVPPSAAALDWADKRLQAVGEGRRLVFIVRDGSVVEERLETEGGLTGLVTRQPSARYTANLDVEARVIDSTGRMVAVATVQVSRTMTVDDSATEPERRAAVERLVEELMSDADRELEATLRQQFFPFLVSS